ncbi:hypothetical protein V6Z11_D06G156200 [Gossypium hirsutum]
MLRTGEYGFRFPVLAFVANWRIQNNKPWPDF